MKTLKKLIKLTVLLLLLILLFIVPATVWVLLADDEEEAKARRPQKVTAVDNDETWTICQYTHSPRPYISPSKTEKYTSKRTEHLANMLFQPQLCKNSCQNGISQLI